MKKTLCWSLLIGNSILSILMIDKGYYPQAVFCFLGIGLMIINLRSS